MGVINATLQHLLALTIGLIAANAQLFPIEPKLRDDIYNVIIPSERQTLDDCTTRYYRYGRNNLASPVLGTPVNFSEFAHMTAIGVQQDTNGAINWFCGGSLISDNWVLSAAHCVSLRGLRANKARLGDRNPFTTLDDEFAQEFDIVDIVIHPEYQGRFSYYDLALFKLGGSIRPDKTVLPACLWTMNDTDVLQDFNMEAIGFGATGTDEGLAENVEKVNLNYVDDATCRSIYGTARKIPNGLVDHQLCARGALQGNLRQDTCQGDSGGPLQVKLLSNGRMTSFIVGIVSFGRICGSNEPGVYTKVSYFRDWIERTVGLDYEPRKCVLRYVSLREFQPGLLETAPRSNEPGASTESILRSNWINSKIHIARDYRHKAYVGSYKLDGKVHWHCGASLIAERWLLTAAHCFDSRPTVAQAGDLRIFSTADDHLGQLQEIETLVPHPEYRAGQVHNDIGLVKLKNDIKISLDIVPACLWKDNELPTDSYEVVGWGSRVSNLFFIDLPVWEVENDEVFPIVTELCDETCQVNKTKPLELRLDKPNIDEIRYLEINSTILPNQQCNNYFRNKNQNEIKETQICLQNEMFVVPGICDLDIGGPVERKVWGYNEYSSFIFGVNSFGKNCGFGTPAVATRVSAFANWIEETVLHNTAKRIQKRQLNSFHFADHHLHENDPCTIPGGSNNDAAGVCKHDIDCPQVVEFYQQIGRSVHFCSFIGRPTVCCPNRLWQQQSAQLTIRAPPGECRANYRELRTRSKENTYENNKVFTHLAAVGFPKSTLLGGVSNVLSSLNLLGTNRQRVDYKCWGALVSEALVVTTASCITTMRANPVQVRLGNFNVGYSQLEVTIPVLETIKHEGYIPGRFYNDIAALKLEGQVQISTHIIPACLWTSNDRVPFVGVVPGPVSTEDIKYSCDNGVCSVSNSIDRERALLSMQVDECERAYGNDPAFVEGVKDTLLCVQAPQLNSTDTCLRVPGSVFQKSIDYEGVNVPYIVGLYSYAKDCHLDKPAMFTRISAYSDWISSKI